MLTHRGSYLLVLIEAIKTLEAKNAEMREDMNAKDALIDDLAARLDRLEKLVGERNEK